MENVYTDQLATTPLLSTQPSYSTGDLVVNPFSGAIKLQPDF